MHLVKEELLELYMYRPRVEDELFVLYIKSGRIITYRSRVEEELFELFSGRRII